MSLLSAPIAAWIEKVTGTPVADVQELTGGASRNSYILTGANGTKSFLRLDAGHGPLSGTVFTLEREYGVLASVQGKGIPIAKVLDFSREHNAILMEFVPGHTSYQKIGTAEEEASLRRQLMAAVVALQKIDTRQIKALGDYCGEPLGVAVPAELSVWRKLYDERVAKPDPMVLFSFNWLTQAVPNPERRAVLVHGDVGPGNFLVRDGEIKALIDWEMTRAGHPLEDVACIIARALGAPFGEAHEHVENYERLTGARVDYKDLDYALTLVFARWMVGIQMGLSKPSAMQNIPMLFIFQHINGLALVEALCRQFDLPVAIEPVQFRGSDPCNTVITYSSECLTLIAAGESVPGADRYKLKGVVDILSYLRAFIDYGPERYEREEIEAIQRLTGRSVQTAAEANEAICTLARTVKAKDARPFVDFLRWRVIREHGIMRTALGERKDNRILFD